MTWRMGMAFVLALPLVAALALGKIVYFIVQEVLVVMLLTGVSVAVVLLLSVVFVLFQEGVRRAALWIKTGILRLAKLSHRHVIPPDPIIQPPLQR
jgi:hypothetical protein